MLILNILLFELINRFIDEPKDISTRIGSTIIFRCRTKPFDDNEITWCKNDFCTLGKRRDLPSYHRYEIIGQPDKGEHDFKIENVSLEDIGMYQCQIRGGVERSPSISRKAKLTVFRMFLNKIVFKIKLKFRNSSKFIHR
jgi:hypothetical protein